MEKFKNDFHHHNGSHGKAGHGKYGLVEYLINLFKIDGFQKFPLL